MKSPAFQFYAADFLSDRNTIVMSAEEVGAYWLLICVCWREGSLPDDMEELAALSRVPLERFQASWDKRIRRCFELRGDGQLVHPRLEAERIAQGENRIKKQRAANARHHPDDVQAQSTRNADAVQVECPSSASSTSSATAQEKDSRRDAGASKRVNVIWDLGVNMLVNVGWTEPNARSFIGKQAKDYGNKALAQAISATSQANVANPHEYLVKVLKSGGAGQNGHASGQKSKVEKSMDAVNERLAEIEEEKRCQTQVH